jgi:hypothetical protein
MGSGSAVIPKASLVQEHRVNHYRLLLERAVSQRPESLLLVGSVSGLLLRSCRQFGVPAAALETDPGLVETLTRQGLPAMCWDRQRMPSGNKGYDWVTLHAAELDPASADDALREALRVARSGLVLAQPWFDLSLPDQELAATAEQWLQAQRLRRGESTGAVLSIDRVMRALPEVKRGEVEGQYVLRWRERPAADLRSEGEALLADLGPAAPQRRELAELVASVAAAGLSWSGMLVTLVRKARPAGTVVASGW